MKYFVEWAPPEEGKRRRKFLPDIVDIPDEINNIDGYEEFRQTATKWLQKEYKETVLDFYRPYDLS